MKRIRRGLFFTLTAAVGLWLGVSARAQTDNLEDRPFQPSPAVVKGTVAALTDSSDQVVALALRSLADWRQASAAPEVRKLLAPENPTEVRMEALRFFSRLGEAAAADVPELIKYAADPDPNIRVAVLEIVFEARASAKNLETLRTLLSDARADVRAAAARCLGQAKKAAAPYRKELLQALAASGAVEFKVAALNALQEIGGLSAAEAESFRPLLRSPEAELRVAAWALTLSTVAAASAAGELPAEKLEAIRATLRPMFENEPPEVKVSIIEEACKSKGVANTFIEALLRQIQNGTPEVQATALRVLGKAGDAGLARVPLVVERAGSADSIVRAAAIAAVGELGAGAAKPNLDLLAKALRDPSDLVREEALRALPVAGDALRNFPYKILDIFPNESAPVRATLVKAVPIILNVKGVSEETTASGRAALKDTNVDVRVAVAYVIGQMGGKAGKELLPNLLDMTKDEEPAARGAALIALRAFAADADLRAQLRQATRPLLKDRDASVRWAALDTLHELEPAQEPGLVAEIAGLLKDEDESVRNAAVRALGAAGQAAKLHLLDIIRFFNDDPAMPPFAAAQTILEISPLNAQELTSLLYPLYLYADLLPLVRVTAYGAAGGEHDGQLLVKLLGHSGATAAEVVTKEEAPHALELLQSAQQAPLLHAKLRTEIARRIAELKAPR